jgi:hypothetical protein
MHHSLFNYIFYIWHMNLYTLMAQPRGLPPLTFSTIEEPPYCTFSMFPVYLFPALKHNPAASPRTSPGTSNKPAKYQRGANRRLGRAREPDHPLGAFCNHPTRWSIPLFSIVTHESLISWCQSPGFVENL